MIAVILYLDFCDDHPGKQKNIVTSMYYMIISVHSLLKCGECMQAIYLSPRFNYILVNSDFDTKIVLLKV